MSARLRITRLEIQLLGRTAPLVGPLDLEISAGYALANLQRAFA